MVSRSTSPDDADADEKWNTVIIILPEGDMKVCTIFPANPSNTCQDFSFSKKQPHGVGKVSSSGDHECRDYISWQSIQ